MQNTSDMIEPWIVEWQSLLRLPLFSSDYCHLIISNHLAWLQTQLFKWLFFRTTLRAFFLTCPQTSYLWLLYQWWQECMIHGGRNWILRQSSQTEILCYALFWKAGLKLLILFILSADFFPLIDFWKCPLQIWGLYLKILVLSPNAKGIGWF